MQRHLEARTGAALLILDLDGFKLVNDCHDHETGDRVLREAAGRIASAVCSADGVYRLGGDEFGVILLTSDTAAVGEVASRIVSALQEPFPGWAA